MPSIPGLSGHIVCRLIFLVCIFGNMFLATTSHAAAFELRDGDRVVFLGNTLIEREQQTGHWETMLTAAWLERNITFRNLGWSGDTVWADSRGIFDNPATGYKRMIDQLKELKPTVVFLGYGGNEAFAGVEGLPRFQAQLDQLLKEIDSLKARVVFLSPIRHENMGSPLPDPAEINAKLAVYTKALKEVAARRGEPFVDLYQPLPSREKFLESTGVHHLTNNGLHLTETGYIEMAHRIRESLQIPADRWARAANNPDSPDGQALRNLREAIIEKNFLYFQNWRPQNVTYLFLFRKHEQGNNAGEVAEFQKLVVEQEKKIAELRKAWAATK